MPKPLPLIEPLSAQPCCAPLAAAPLTKQEAADFAGRLKALADPSRLRLVSLLMASADREACTCDLIEPLGLSQPTVTHHLKKLLDAGLITAERRGVWTYYAVVPAELRRIAEVLTPSA